MTPLLLTLATLTSGDGGPGGGAARAPVEAVVTVKLGDWFKGFIRLPGGPLYRAEVAGKRFTSAKPRG
jgi:hypothetical protein